jgi:hypothetical protein
MKRCMGLAGVVFLSGAAVAAAAPAPERKPPTAEEIAKAVKVVQGDEKLTARGAVIAAIEDAAVGKALLDYVFVSVMFRQFPVGRVPPEGLKASNVFAVDRDGKVTVLTDAKELEKFFRANLAPAKEDDQLKEDARAWIRLAQQFRQDGFFQFSLMDEATKVSPAEGGKSVSATVVAMRGGSGTLAATLTFDEAGKLTKVAEENKLRPGPRPICQATKLLDADPVVRRMAEQDLLLMGTAARPYLDEQHAKAAPELRQAIDRLWQRIVDAER